MPSDDLPESESERALPWIICPGKCAGDFFVPENQIEGMAAITSAMLPAVIIHAGKSRGRDGAILPAALPATVFNTERKNKMNLFGSRIVYIGER